VVGRIRSTNCNINNATLSSVSVTGREAVGGAIGADEGGSTFSNIRVNSGSVTSSYTGEAYIGGLIGRGTASNLTISNSSANVTVNAGTASEIAGGFLGGMSAGTITRCYATGSVNGGIDRVGGFAGFLRPSVADGNVSETYATGTVTAASGAARVGSYAGWAEAVNFDLTISNSFARGNVSAAGASDRVGGFIGRFDHATLGDTITVQNVYAFGSVTGSTNVNGWGPQIVLNAANLITNGCFYDSTKNSSSVRGTGLSTTTMQDEANRVVNYAGFDFDIDGTGPDAGEWVWDSTANLPTLKNLQ
jgi:hypothetical protein